MNTVKKGDAFEDRVYAILNKELNAGRLGLDKKCSRIFKKKGYYSRDRESDIIIDISIEIWLPNAKNWSLLWICECKDLSKPVPVDDVEEFVAKLKQITGANVKGMFASTNSFSKGAFNYARSKGIGVIRVFPSDNIEWKLYFSAPIINSDFTFKLSDVEIKITDPDFENKTESISACYDESLFLDWASILRYSIQKEIELPPPAELVIPQYEEEFSKKLILSSISLNEIDKSLMPVNAASACLIKYTGNLIVLTVAHATSNFKDWVIQIGWDNEKGNQLYRIGQMNFLHKFSLFNGSEDVDFSYAIIRDNIKPLYQVTVDNKIYSIPKTPVETTLEDIPNKQDKYGFFGFVKFRLYDKYLICEQRLEIDMRFIEEQGDFYIFQINGEIVEDEDYLGCSGAPIMNREGKIIALVVGGNKKKNQIIGIGLNKYKIAIDIECGNIK